MTTSSADTAIYIENVPSGVSQLADDLYEAVYSLYDYIAVNGNITEDDTLIAIDLMRQKHPEIFYLEFANTETDEGRLTGIMLKYRYDADEVPTMRDEYESSVSEALSWTSEEYTEIQNAKALHDYIVLHTAYGYHGNVAFGDESHTAY